MCCPNRRTHVIKCGLWGQGPGQKNMDGPLVLALLEEIDDDLDELDVLLVKINEATVASDFGIEDRPTLVIFEKG